LKAEYVLKEVCRIGEISFFPPDNAGAAENIRKVLIQCKEKNNGYVLVTFSTPRKPRTTGKDSQNSHIWGHIQQIANETGNDVADVELAVKERALKRGYPTKMSAVLKRPVPVSMTEIDTVQAGYLIDELHQLAAELDIILREA
jgi:hypothetical protein